MVLCSRFWTFVNRPICVSCVLSNSKSVPVLRLVGSGLVRGLAADQTSEVQSPLWVLRCFSSALLSDQLWTLLCYPVITGANPLACLSPLHFYGSVLGTGNTLSYVSWLRVYIAWGRHALSWLWIRKFGVSTNTRVGYMAWTNVMRSCLPEVLKQLRHGKCSVSVLHVAISFVQHLDSRIILKYILRN